MQTRTLECIQCGNSFELSTSEQEYYRQRGFDEPRRCPECRKNKRREPHNDTRKFRNKKKKHYRMKYDDDSM
ncbi:MAG: zinc-ribbon domain-containing protein [Desulfobacterales bacterium]|jgi:NAD-dependent SIR2 family protein deacetylase|nr:zinc-ribbon domain-containing protein [Desulfobacterales bacterium]